MPDAKVHISLADGVLQIEGSETFVADQLARLEPHIVQAFANVERRGAPLPSQGAKSSDRGASATFEEFDHLFAEANGKVQILRALPGNNNAAKTVSAALLLAFAHSLQGRDSIPSDSVRELCRAHACFDSSNFAGILKREKELFLLEGTGSSKDIRLTVPGRKRAEDLARQLNSA